VNGGWLASYVALWVLVLVLSVAVIALLREIGVLHTRIAPMGTHFAGEGPELSGDAPDVGLDWSASALTAVVFTSPTCVICKELVPSIAALRRQYREVRLQTVDLDDSTQPVFDAFRVRSTPYVVTVGRDGIVRGRGVANTLEQMEELVRESLLGPAADRTAMASTTNGDDGTRLVSHTHDGT
jgi:thiol-disulfide isomerase/thioredoxin